MPEKPHEKKEIEKKEQDSSWEKDQREKSYYYDDACGYEDYNPNADDEEDEDL
jgi:hypothetical protein